ncbi:MAG TPA: hypothetical protein VN253_23015, partial [Kofleriaceae bacterium]|nr:hypothetical protein [Kofleriaceae bacterium]
ARLDELFGAVAASIQATSRFYTFRYLSAAHYLEVFRTYYGPIHKAFAALDSDPEKQAAFGREMIELMGRFNRSGNERLVAPGEYLEVVIEKKR